MGADEKELEEILRIKRRRLNELNKQIARLGYEAPPHLVTERDDLRVEVEKDKQSLEPIIKGELSDEAMAALRAFGVPSSIANAMQSLEERYYDLRNELRAFRDDRLRKDQSENEKRETRQQESDTRFARIELSLFQMRTIGLLILFAILAGFIGYALR